MFRPRVRCTLALATVLCAAGRAGAQGTTIRVNVNLVRAVATVKTQSGQVIGSLRKEDFEIYDNGVKQEVAVFEHQAEQRLSVALLVDVSGSTAKELAYESDSAQRFIRALLGEGHPEDAIKLYTFNWQVTDETGRYTRDQKLLTERLKAMHGDAGTAMYDAIFFAARDLEPREGRKVIVVVTDGGDTVSKLNLQAALQEAQLADAVIYAIVVVPITNEAGRNIGGEHALQFMAEGTGGRTFMPSVGTALDKAFTDILTELRTQYLLAFYPRDVPPNKNRFHRLEVRVKNPDLRVSARNGYYGEFEGEGSSPDERVSISPERQPQPTKKKK
ncbi:MAG TPA: VWA domain-containing protein [Candidatus Acidoferrales bacterium]|nr:VWA domain-containing protein [Candidatus Acidoferrales bacterium]